MLVPIFSSNDLQTIESYSWQWSRVKFIFTILAHLFIQYDIMAFNFTSKYSLMAIDISAEQYHIIPIHLGREQNRILAIILR